MTLYECDIEGCDWTNPNWRYGLAEAGATWASHASAHADGTRAEAECPHENVRTFRSVPPHSKCLNCGALVKQKWCVIPPGEKGQADE